jgi:Golgi apparatus protein 1
MDDHNVFQLLEKVCKKDIANLDKCKPENGNQLSNPLSGKFLSCILENRDEIRSPPCRGQIQRLESVAFSDFKLIGFFVQDCNTDIEDTGCGRVQSTRTNNKLSQGETLACLQSHIDNLSDKCKRSVLHLSELQAENIKFDRQLFLLCTGDASHFCPELHPGGGQIIKCLLRFKSDPKMSKQCQEQLERHDKLISHDYKISRGLARACKEDIKQNRCRRGVSDDKDVRLAQILLCLENVQKNSTRIQPECAQEMQEHRKMLMDDYNLSPEIITDCSEDIRRFCQNLNGPNTLHCLMEHSRPRRKKDRRVTAQCQRAVEQLIKVSDVGEDWRVDPVLRQACKPVVDIACRDTEGGDARVMSCLMEKLGTNYMTDNCELALLQIQYFIARDFKLDPQLYRNCKEDAIKFCHAKSSWADVEPSQMDPERGPLVLPCLHRYAYHPENEMQLSQACFQEVKRVMRQRAVSVDLIPEVEDKCIDDLSINCFDKTAKGEEMQCLQDNLEKLDKECKEAVISFTEEQGQHIELNPIIMTVCGEAMEKYCDSLLKTGKDEGMFPLNN